MVAPRTLISVIKIVFKIILVETTEKNWIWKQTMTVFYTATPQTHIHYTKS